MTCEARQVVCDGLSSSCDGLLMSCDALWLDCDEDLRITAQKFYGKQISSVLWQCGSLPNVSQPAAAHKAAKRHQAVGEGISPRDLDSKLLNFQF
jgi:hypothetical protein